MSTKYTLPPHVHLNPREMQDAVLEFRKWKESVETRLARLEESEWLKSTADMIVRFREAFDKQPFTEQIDPPPDSTV